MGFGYTSVVDGTQKSPDVSHNSRWVVEFHY